MAELQHSDLIDASPDEVFAYLSDVRNLPRYFPGMTHAEVIGADRQHDGDRVAVGANIGGNEREAQAWFRVDDAARRIEWGSPAEQDYHGWLTVEDETQGAGTSTSLTLALSTPHVDESQVDLRGAVERIRNALAGDVED